MANIVTRRNGHGLSNVYDPFSVFDDLLRWEPFAGMLPSRLIGAQAPAFNAKFEIKETKGDYLIRADLPGVEDKDVDITVTGNTLTIRGKREAEKTDETDRYHMVERCYGSFSRSFVLPEDTDLGGVKAELRNGVLTVAVAKKPEDQPRKISIKTIAEKVAGVLGGNDKSKA